MKKEQIYEIPINDAFDLGCGCPICKLHRDYEAASVAYVLGAAMMEPDVRASTNEMGFCAEHFAQMQNINNRLGLALLLQSHLAEVIKRLDEKKTRSPAALCAIHDTCFVCDRVAGVMKHYYDNIVYLWAHDTKFREKFGKQPYYCVRHAAELLQCAEKQLSKKEYGAFSSFILDMNKNHAEHLLRDVSAFCKGFDYRFTGESDREEAKTSVSRAIAFLSGAQEAAE